MDDKTLQRLANLATIKNHTLNILNVGRGVVPKPQLHKIQQEAMKLDRMFVDLLLESSASSEEDDIADISKRVLEEKAKIAEKKATSVARVSVADATQAAQEAAAVEAPVKKAAKKSKAKKKSTSRKKTVANNAQASAQ